MVDRLVVAMADQPVGGGPPIPADEEGYTSNTFCGVCGRQHIETRGKMRDTPAQQWRCPRCTKLKITLQDVACAPGFLGGSAEWLNASTSSSSFEPPSKDPFVLEIDVDHAFTRAMVREAVQLGIRRAVRALSA